MELVAAYKRSAIHNLRIDIGGYDPASVVEKGINEGLALPEELRIASDLAVGESVIVARIDGDNLHNRVRTFVVPAQEERVEARGSLGHFLGSGDLVCVISETRLGESGRALHLSGDLHIVDYGIVPGDDHRGGTLKHERLSRPDEVVKIAPETSLLREKLMPRVMLRSLITDLVVNDTNANCLLGSAEIPAPVMDRVGMSRHTMVTVFNASAGGCTETYAVPMPPGVVMTTGAMAGFAPVGLGDQSFESAVVRTDGNEPIS